MTRATKAEMESRYQHLTDLAYEHGPCSVRHIYYRAVVAGVVPKNESGYNKVQRAVLDLRREGEIPYQLITDNTRWVTEAETWNGVEDVLRHTARTYRRNLWAGSEYRVEVWVESDSIGGTIHSVVDKWAVPMFVCRGQVSESFAHSAVETWKSDPDPTRIVLYIGDHDPAGIEIENSLIEKLDRFNDDDSDFVEYEFMRMALTWDQIRAGDLPGSPPKKDYGYPLAVEAEALPPNELRDLIDGEIEMYVDHHDLYLLQVAEKSEREIFMRMAGEVA
ncbi:hypothetical protein BH23ACT4_BH23ACT4_03670 [soil metagenome]